MQKVKTNVDDFLDNINAEIRDDIKHLDKLISKIFVGEERVLWQGRFWGGSDQNIIGYGDLKLERPGKPTVEWFMVGLALQKNYISLYVMGVKNGKYLAEIYKDKLGKAKVGKSSISFKKLVDIDLPSLTKMLEESRNINVK